MSEVRAMVVYPFDAEKEEQLHQQTEPKQNFDNSIQQGSGSNNIFHIIQMVIKLSQINGFNDNFNIRGSDGQFIPNTNIAKLLGLTQHRVRTQKGVPELINLLYEAKIDPNIIHNEGIKAKLLELYSSPPNENNESNGNNNYSNSNNESNVENINEESMDTANESEPEQTKTFSTPSQDK